MHFQIVTLFPDMFVALEKDGVIGQAIRSGRIRLSLVNPREFTEDRHRTVDDRPFGGGDGMLMLAEPLAKALESLPVIGRCVLLSPQGQLMTDSGVREFAKHILNATDEGEKTITLICGRYAGIDQRFINEFVDEEVSIGDFVLSGGELPAMVFVDAIARFVPGVLGHADSAENDSISMGHLESPQFTRPQSWRNIEAPAILSSGHHQKMERWKCDVGLMVTFHKRPDLLPKVLESDFSKNRSKRDISRFEDEIRSWQPADFALLGLNHFAIDDFLRYWKSLYRNLEQKQ